jgi:hypothetical protein
MALSFPTGPTPGQVYAAPNGVNYTWNSSAGVWTASASGGAAGTVQAWVNFDGQPGSPTIRASGNVSSVTKAGTGQYTVNFTTSMPDANYAITGTSSGGAGSDNVFLSVYKASVPTTTSVSVNCYVSNTGSVQDPVYVSVAIVH